MASWGHSIGVSGNIASRGKPHRHLRLEQLESRMLLDAGPVYISEFMAKNNKTYENNAGTFSDWLELYNPTSTAVTLGSATAGQSYYLTNDSTNLTQWAFPAGVTLGAGAYLVVNCDTTPSGGTGGLYEHDGCRFVANRHHAVLHRFSPARVGRIRGPGSARRPDYRLAI